jgi:hypothetical protein
MFVDLNEEIIGSQMVKFKPNSGKVERICGHLDEDDQDNEHDTDENDDDGISDTVMSKSDDPLPPRKRRRSSAASKTMVFTTTATAAALANSMHVESLGSAIDADTIFSIDSTIVCTDKMKQDLVRLCKLDDKQFKLLYRGSRDGFEAESFHAKCDNQTKTLTVIQSADNGFIFGGYAHIAWTSYDYEYVDANAFLFSLVNAMSKPIYMPVKAADEKRFKPPGDQAVNCHPKYGPMFGGGNDINIATNSNRNTKSFSNLGKSFEFKEFNYRTNEARSFLAGSFNFKTREVEVFALI